ncbi:hypothetical protein R1sor_022566 [Riccia sorocarpa]|uniref:Uncharacterized protein n=1 Tax=Riccia sorocarpa TaxID=122646 RepID=A0ABD3GNE2_9MARC
MDSSRSNPLVNIRGVKRKIEEAVTMLFDFEKDGQKDVAFAALCEDEMECLQKRVADFETDLEEIENELLEARGVIFQQQVKIDDAERRHNDELDRLSRLMTGLNKEVRALIKQLDISTKNCLAAVDIVSATREKLARTEDRCHEVLNQNRVAYDALLAELGRSPSAPSPWDLLLEVTLHVYVCCFPPRLIVMYSTLATIYL